MDWMLMPYHRYADFSGRSQRKEYWMFMLFYMIVAMIFVGLMLAAGGLNSAAGGPGFAFWVIGGLLMIFVLGSFIPALAVTVRRFHDQDKSGWMFLLQFIPYVGGIIVFVFMLLKGTAGPNRYGPDPLDPNHADTFA